MGDVAGGTRYVAGVRAAADAGGTSIRSPNETLSDFVHGRYQRAAPSNPADLRELAAPCAHTVRWGALCGARSELEQRWHWRCTSKRHAGEAATTSSELRRDRTAHRPRSGLVVAAD